MNGVEFGYLLSILSLIVASIVGFTNLRRNNSADDKKQSAEMTTVIVKLENINIGINEEYIYEYITRGCTIRLLNYMKENNTGIVKQEENEEEG